MKHRQEGVTLIELMISLVLGLIVAGLAIQLLLQSRSSQSTQEATSFLQESARYVVYRLRPVIRNAGYAGCANVRSLTVGSGVEDKHDISRPFGGSQASYKGESYWKLSFVAAEKFGGDVPLSAPMNTLISEITAGDFLNTDYRKNFRKVIDKSGVALITDCEAADIFALASDPDDPDDPNNSTYATDDGALGVKVKPKTALAQLYGGDNSANSYLYPVSSWALELRSQKDTDVPALFLVDEAGGNKSRTQELVSGIEGYRVTVSLDTSGNGQPDKLNQNPVAVNAANEWDKVVRVELAFTLRSLPGVIPGGTDNGRMKRDFQLTFSPRNLPLR